MKKFFVAFGLAIAWMAGHAAVSTELTATERAWLRGAQPVLAYAKNAGLPVDVIVQPQPTAGEPPLALAFVDGRCKLVLSMRGNPEADATLRRIAPDVLAETIELMAAHELGHCRRYLAGAWHGLPRGFVERVPNGLSAEQRVAYADMAAARREEGYGDLVGLAWTAQRHPELYGRLQAWLIDERSRDFVAGSPHDTLAWVRLGRRGDALAYASIFDAALVLWLDGLTLDN